MTWYLSLASFAFAVFSVLPVCRVCLTGYSNSSSMASTTVEIIIHKAQSSLVAQMVKHLSIMWETWVQSLGWEDPLEKEMAIHCSTIAWKIPWTEEPGRLQSTVSQRVGYDWVTSLSLPWTFYCYNWHIIILFFSHPFLQILLLYFCKSVKKYFYFLIFHWDHPKH